MSEKWFEVSDFEGRRYWRRDGVTIAEWEVEDKLTALQNEADRLRSNFDWLDKFEQDHSKLERYIEFRQRSEEVGVLAAIEEYRTEEEGVA